MTARQKIGLGGWRDSVSGDLAVLWGAEFWGVCLGFWALWFRGFLGSLQQCIQTLSPKLKYVKGFLVGGWLWLREGDLREGLGFRVWV